MSVYFSLVHHTFSRIQSANCVLGICLKQNKVQKIIGCILGLKPSIALQSRERVGSHPLSISLTLPQGIRLHRSSVYWAFTQKTLTSPNVQPSKSVFLALFPPRISTESNAPFTLSLRASVHAERDIPPRTLALTLVAAFFQFQSISVAPLLAELGF